MSTNTLRGHSAPVNGPHRRRGAQRQWTDEKVAAALREATGVLGSFPTASELRAMGRNDLLCATTKAGGLMAWSERLGLPRKHSDSDTGWGGEAAVCGLFEGRGIHCRRTDCVKCPYDLIAAGVLRVDVKSARYAEYRQCRGWFFRIGKHPQADVIALYKIDTGGVLFVPWWDCPTGNLTLSVSGGKYAGYADDWDMVRRLIHARTAERVAVDLAGAQS